LKLRDVRVEDAIPLADLKAELGPNNRVVARIKDERITKLAVRVAHRRDIYR